MRVEGGLGGNGLGLIGFIGIGLIIGVIGLLGLYWFSKRKKMDIIKVKLKKKISGEIIL